MIKKIWVDFYGLSLDKLPISANQTLEEIRKNFSQSNWEEKYDLIEYFVHQFKLEMEQYNFTETTNDILKEENAAYRFISNILAPVTDDIQITSIQSAINSPFDIASNHIKKSLEHLSNKKHPDYSACISNAIHAVENLAREITNKPDSTLGEISQNLTKLDQDRKLALKNLYGYASDRARHAEKKNKIPTFEDALFMLVVCSAYVNLLKKLYPA